MICERCQRETLASTCSIFNTEQICMACSAAERAHPEYEQAARFEAEAVRKGDYNYPGIGLPADLRP